MDFEIIGELADIETIATGNSIRELARLRQEESIPAFPEVLARVAQAVEAFARTKMAIIIGQDGKACGHKTQRITFQKKVFRTAKTSTQDDAGNGF